MEQIVIQVRDKDKAKILLELLTALDFVDSVKTSGLEETEVGSSTPEETPDFFAVAGLWQGRAISLESIRQKAWPRQYR